MSEKNVEIVRRFIDAFRRRDEAGMVALSHPEAEFRSFFSTMEGRTYGGHPSIQQYFSDIDSTFEDWHTQDEEFLDAGGVEWSSSTAS